MLLSPFERLKTKSRFPQGHTAKGSVNPSLISKAMFIQKLSFGAPGWLSLSVPTSAQVMISQLVSSSPALGSVLTAGSLEPASDSVSISLCPFPAHALSLSNINKTLKKLKNNDKIKIENNF